MKGGAIEINSLRYGDISADQAFIIFEQNSTKDFYMLGTTGILFLLKLEEGYISPFVSLNPIGKEIKILIVKYVLFSHIRYFFKYKNQENIYRRIETVTEEETIKECDIQRHVYESSNGYISPICPFVVSFYIRLKVQCFFLQNVEEISDRDPKNIQAEQSKRGHQNNISNFGVIAMELPNNFEPLHKKSEDRPIYKAISIFEILRLFFECSIIHGDLHGGNIIIVEDASYFGIYPYRATIIDYGRSFINEKTKPATHNKKTMNFENACKDYKNLRIMMDFIYNAGRVYNGKFIQYSIVPNQYQWIKDESVLISIFTILPDLYTNRQIQISEMMKTYRPFVTISDMGSSHQGMPIIDMKFIQDIISQGSRQRLLPESELLNSIVGQAAREHILHFQQDKITDLNTFSHIASQYYSSQFNLFQKIKELLFLSENKITQNIRELIYTIIYLQVSQGQMFGGAAPAITTEYSFNQLTQYSKKGSNKKENKKAEITAKIAEIKQIQADMADTFADWRNEVYKIYTNPNIEEKNAYYQEQTPFTILTHLMVCCGLFGPLKSGMYIDVKEEENKELYDKLNSIAAAFVTMNKGYLSTSTAQMQLMIEDVKTSTATVEKVVEPTVEVRQDIDIDKSLIGPAEMINQSELVAGFGGNKKYSRRKERRHSKRQKKYCRRKSNKRFYSKKRYSKKRRKYSKR